MKISYDHCHKTFPTVRGAVTAVRQISMTVEAGEFFVLLGPSGCGKSTLLNLTAGLEKLTMGEIRYDDQIVDGPGQRIFLAPRERNAAMVFQSYALYPHMDVAHNIGFPLRIAGTDRAEIEQAVRRTADLLGIGNLLDRKPAELSGGQRQRVAIARALVRKPRVFLLDEPLSNLDAQLRASTRMELKRLQRELGVTTIYVTHDQTEAMTLGDRIALLKDGALVQVDTPLGMYKLPRTPFAATFIGSPPMNLLGATLEEEAGQLLVRAGGTLLRPSQALVEKFRQQKEKEVLVGIRPEHLQPAAEDHGPALAATVKTQEPLGRETLVHVDVDGHDLVFLNPRPEFRSGQHIRLMLLEEKLHLFRKDHRP